MVRTRAGRAASASKVRQPFPPSRYWVPAHAPNALSALVHQSLHAQGNQVCPIPICYLHGWQDCAV